jgi:hypothetical protein
MVRQRGISVLIQLLKIDRAGGVQGDTRFVLIVKETTLYNVVKYCQAKEERLIFIKANRVLIKCNNKHEKL